MLTRTFRATVLCLLGVAAASCSGGGAHTPPDPPSVQLSVPDSNRYGTTFEFTVAVTGCDNVTNVSIYNHDVYIYHVNYAPPQTTVTLQANQIPYSYGIAAPMTLVAKALCGDGRLGASAPAAASFFPVGYVYNSVPGTPNVPEVFIADGSGSSTGFIGCSTNNAGNPIIIKTDKNGSVLASVNLAQTLNSCRNLANITSKAPLSGNRWLWDPGIGAVEFDSNLNIHSWLASSISALSVGPDGDAVVWDNSTGLNQSERIPHGKGPTATGPSWIAPAPGGTGSSGSLLTNPVINRDLTVYLAWWVVRGSTGTVTVQKLDYRTGQEIAEYNVVSMSYDPLSGQTAPPAAFDPTGAIVYVATQTATGISQVEACATNAVGCVGPGVSKWPAGVNSLNGVIELLMPYAQGSRIAAISAKAAYFLNANDGTLVRTVNPTGSQVANQVQAGVGRDFYLLNGPLSRTALPTEVIALDSAENGEVFRYGVQGGSMSLAVDDAGALWLRIGTVLTQPLSLAQYRAVHP